MAWIKGHPLYGGKYIVQKKLGEGGFGITYLAATETGDRVVIKTLNEDVQKRSDFEMYQNDFLNESLRIAKCQHQHIVKVIELFQEKVPHPTQPSRKLLLSCMVLEYIDGQNLADYVTQQGGVLSESEALRYIRQIGEALMVVHEQGLLHRDVKPLNIMLRSKHREAVLIDFGIARDFVPDMTMTHTQLMTPGYAPVEQYDPHTRRGAYTDVYSLAATLYAITTGTVPPSSETRELRLLKNQPDPLQPPKERNPALSDRLNAAIMKGMAVKPQDRPKTMMDWFDELRVKINPQPIAPSPSRLVTSPVTVTTVQVNDQGEITEEYPVQVQVYDEDLGDGVSLRMVEIPGGSYTQGSPKGEVEWSSRERPQRTVTVPRLFMGMFQVTQSQYVAVMGENPSHFRGDNRPVEQVSWNDAKTFCDRLSDCTGYRYSLPTEAEWEYACRAGTTTPFYFGNTLSTEIANYDGNDTYGNGKKGTFRRETTPVGQFPPNAFGLYDMHGNVWEWCADHYRENYKGVPTDGSPYITNDSSSTRVLRGGSWGNHPRHCRSACRNGELPDGRFYSFGGFRIVVSSAWTPA